MGIMEAFKTTSLLWAVLLISVALSSSRKENSPYPHIMKHPINVRGGSAGTVDADASDVFQELAAAFRSKVQTGDPDISDEKVRKAIAGLASSQSTLKGLDGAAHEAYQRTHTNANQIVDTAVAGRAQRSAQRIGATAEALFACELIESLQNPALAEDEIFQDRKVILNTTSASSSASTSSSNEDAKDGTRSISLGKHSKISVLVLYDQNYHGGSGLDHGSIKSWSTSSSSNARPTGRLLVVLGNDSTEKLKEVIQMLGKKPQKVRLSSGLVTDEVASVHPSLFKAAAELLILLEPILQDEKYKSCAIHFVGHSLPGAVAALAATILDGTLSFPKSVQETVERIDQERKRANSVNTTLTTSTDNETATNELLNKTEHSFQPLHGLGKGKTSAISLGSPPCLSSNVLAAFCTSFLYGDDVVCRTSMVTIDNLCQRIKSKVRSGFLGNNIGWMTDTVSITMSNLRSHAHGSEGEETSLSVPGRAYLLRPRRLGGLCSIHDVGSLQKGGREALRARLLWQLNDILLSRSMWKHHQLESYISGLDRVQLRGIGNAEEF